MTSRIAKMISDKPMLKDAWGHNFTQKLKNHELRSLEKNGVFLIKVPFLKRDGSIVPQKSIILTLYPDHIDTDGNFVYGWNGNRIKPKKRR